MQLFAIDNFSNPEIKYKRYIGEKNHFSNILDSYFENHKIIDVWQLDRSEINSENYKIITQERHFLLRRHHTLNRPEQIEFYLELVDNLGNGGVEVSRVIKNKNDSSSTLYKGDLYSLFEFIDATYFFPDEETFESVAMSIARLHHAFNALPEDYNFKIVLSNARVQVYFNIVKDYDVCDFNNILDTISGRDHMTAVDKLVLKKLPNILKIVKQVKAREKEIGELPKGIIHSDLHPHNILIKNKQVKTITDFDAVRISQQARDVAFAIHRFGRQFLVNKNLEEFGKIAPRLRELFVKSYQAIKPLSTEELELMPLLIKDDFLRKLLFVLKSVYQEGNEAWARDLPNFLFAFEEIDYFWPDNV